MKTINGLNIFEGKEILGVDSPYLTWETKQKLGELLQYSEQGEKELTYLALDEAVASVPHSVFVRWYKYGDNGYLLENGRAVLDSSKNPASAIEALISQTSGSGFIGEDASSKQSAAESAMEQYRENFGIKGIYFSDTGFLGFMLNDGRGLMLQIAEPGVDINDRWGTTVPFFKSLRDGHWFGVKYFEPYNHLMGGSPPGRAGTIFTQYMDSQA